MVPDNESLLLGSCAAHSSLLGPHGKTGQLMRVSSDGWDVWGCECAFEDLLVLEI